MKDIIAICFIIVVISLSFTGCAHREKAVDKGGATYEDSFENVAPAEKSVRAIDSVESN
ncbi:MAG: hypothetical protein K1X66_08720 [Verrucomicrobiae bacterium]|nr:hypothetical protein [Verrucomicrobiae bacterium]